MYSSRDNGMKLSLVSCMYVAAKGVYLKKKVYRKLLLQDSFARVEKDHKD